MCLLGCCFFQALMAMLVATELPRPRQLPLLFQVQPGLLQHNLTTLSAQSSLLQHRVRLLEAEGFHCAFDKADP